MEQKEIDKRMAQVDKFLDVANADLHIHTTISDGKNSFYDIVDASHQINQGEGAVEIIAVTDHDNLGNKKGVNEFARNINPNNSNNVDNYTFFFVEGVGNEKGDKSTTVIIPGAEVSSRINVDGKTYPIHTTIYGASRSNNLSYSKVVQTSNFTQSKIKENKKLSVVALLNKKYRTNIPLNDVVDEKGNVTEYGAKSIIKEYEKNGSLSTTNLDFGSLTMFGVNLLMNKFGDRIDHKKTQKAVADLIENESVFRKNFSIDFNGLAKCVHDAGGMITWAHPKTTIVKDPNANIVGMLNNLLENGLDAIETVYNKNDVSNTAFDVASRSVIKNGYKGRKIFTSGGSDLHSLSRADIGHIRNTSIHAKDLSIVRELIERDFQRDEKTKFQDSKETIQFAQNVREKSERVLSEFDSILSNFPDVLPNNSFVDGMASLNLHMLEHDVVMN